MFLTCGLSLFVGFVVSCVSSLGMAIALVEKGDNWPIEPFKKRLSASLASWHEKLPEMLECSVCSSFWLALVADCFLLLLTGGVYFAWPLSGFGAVALTWFVNELLNAIDQGE